MAADTIRLAGMVFYGYHGVRPAERKRGQRFVVDLAVTRDLTAAGRSDDLGDTVSYSEIFRLVKGIVEGPPHNLLESLAGAIGRRSAGRPRRELGHGGGEETRAAHRRRRFGLRRGRDHQEQIGVVLSSGAPGLR